jgi:hypothetical protein
VQGAKTEAHGSTHTTVALIIRIRQAEAVNEVSTGTFTWDITGTMTLWASCFGILRAPFGVDVQNSATAEEACKLQLAHLPTCPTKR